MPNRSPVDLSLELLGRKARADFLLKRQPPVPRVLNAGDRDRLYSLARHGQHDGQRVHDESRIDARRQHGDLCPPRHGINRPCERNIAPHRVTQLLGGRDDRHFRFEDAFDLRHHAAQGRRRAEHDDVRLRFPEGVPRVRVDLHAKRPRQAGDLGHVAPHL